MGLSRIVRIAVRLLTALFLAGAAAGLGLAGFLTGTLPHPLALVLEPLSLLLLPGIVPALLMAGSHDFSPDAVISFAMAFYTLVFLWLLNRPARRA